MSVARQPIAALVGPPASSLDALQHLSDLADRIANCQSLTDILPDVLQTVAILGEAKGALLLKARYQELSSSLPIDAAAEAALFSLLKKLMDRAGITRCNAPEISGWASPTPLLCIPLRARGRSLGVLCALGSPPHIDAWHDQALSLLASQVAQALDRDVPNADFSRRSLTSKAQKTADEILDRFQDLRLALVDPLREIVDALRSDGAVIFLRDREPDKIRVAATYQWPELENRRLTFGQALAGKVAATRRAMCVNNYPSWPERAPLFSRNENETIAKLGSIIGAPIVAHGDLLGVISVTSRPERQRFYDETDIEALAQFLGPDGAVIPAVYLARKISFQRALIDNSPYPVIGANTSGRLAIFNSAASKLTGFEHEDVFDQSAEVIYWGGPLEVVKIHRMLEKRGSIQIESAIRSKQGEKIPVLLSAAFLTDEHGSLLGSVTVFEDLRLKSLKGKIARLITAIERLDHPAHMVQNLTEAIVGEAIELFDADAGCLLLSSGSQFRAHSNVHAPHCRLREMVLGKRSPIVKEILRTRIPALLSETPGKGEIVLQPKGRRAGLLIPIADDAEVHGLILLESGRDKKGDFRFELEFIRFFATRCAAALRRAKIEEALLHSDGNLAAAQVGTVHEIKNSLSNLFWIFREIKEKAGQERALGKKLGVVDAEIERLTALTERLREFLRQVEPQKKISRLNDIVLDTFEVLKSSIQQRGVEPVLDLDPLLGNHTKGRKALIDKDQLSRVIINLTLNALDASRKGGKIVFQTRLCGESAEIRISDTGRGLTTSQTRNLFKPYGSTKRKGTGLGLVISKHIVESHGGHITLRSTPGKGTTVLIQIPLPCQEA